MSLNPSRRNPPGNQAAKSKVTSDDVEDAWQAFAALQRAAKQDPTLLENEYFIALQDTGYARFLLTFEAL